MRKFAVFDLDGTVARTSLYLASVHAMKRRGMLQLEDAATIDTTLKAWLSRDDDNAFEIYSQVTINSLEHALPTIKLAAYNSIVEEVIGNFGKRIYRYTTSLIKGLKTQDYLIFAVSGSELRMVETFCKNYGFDDWVGNRYEHDDTYFTGKTGTTFKDKQQYIEELMNKHNCTIEDSIAVGDTQGDIQMLEFVKNPIAFNPNKTLYDHAVNVGWKIVVERKNVIYELEPQLGKHTLA